VVILWLFCELWRYYGHSGGTLALLLLLWRYCVHVCVSACLRGIITVPPPPVRVTDKLRLTASNRTPPV